MSEKRHKINKIANYQNIIVRNSPAQGGEATFHTFSKVWGILIFPSCTPIRGIYRKSLLNTYHKVNKCSEKVVFEKIFLEWPNGR